MNKNLLALSLIFLLSLCSVVSAQVINVNLPGNGTTYTSSNVPLNISTDETYDTMWFSINEQKNWTACVNDYTIINNMETNDSFVIDEQAFVPIVDTTFVKEGTYSLNLTSDPSIAPTKLRGIWNYNLSTPVDLSQRISLDFWVYIPNKTLISKIMIYLNDNYTNWSTYRSDSWFQAVLHDGWNFISSDILNDYSLTGDSDDLSSTRIIRIGIYNATLDPYTIYVDDMRHGSYLEGAEENTNTPTWAVDCTSTYGCSNGTLAISSENHSSRSFNFSFALYNDTSTDFGRIYLDLSNKDITGYDYFSYWRKCPVDDGSLYTYVQLYSLNGGVQNNGQFWSDWALCHSTDWERRVIWIDKDQDYRPERKHNETALQRVSIYVKEIEVDSSPDGNISILFDDFKLGKDSDFCNNDLNEYATPIILGHSKRIMAFRDDDVWACNNGFNTLLDIHRDNNIPLTLETQAEDLTADCYSNVSAYISANPELFTVSTHGYGHTDYGVGQSQEFGWKRNYTQEYNDISTAKIGLIEDFGYNYYPSFSPPWNIYDNDTFIALQNLGFKVLTSSKYYGYDLTDTPSRFKIKNLDPFVSTNEILFTGLDSFVQKNEMMESVKVDYVHHWNFNSSEFTVYEDIITNTTLSDSMDFVNVADLYKTLGLPDGTYTLDIFVNDTAGTVNTTQITFIVSTGDPKILSTSIGNSFNATINTTNPIYNITFESNHTGTNLNYTNFTNVLTSTSDYNLTTRKVGYRIRASDINLTKGISQDIHYRWWVEDIRGNQNTTWFDSTLSHINLTEGSYAVLWDEDDNQVDSAVPIWVASNSNGQVNIDSTLPYTVNISSFRFTIGHNCNEINTITYTSHSGTYTNVYSNGDYSCSDSVVTLDITGVEQATGSNVLTVDISNTVYSVTNLIPFVFLGGMIILLYRAVTSGSVPGFAVIFLALAFSLCSLPSASAVVWGTQSDFITNAVTGIAVTFLMIFLILVVLKELGIYK